jgi:hypothetical protein
MLNAECTAQLTNIRAEKILDGGGGKGMKGHLKNPHKSQKMMAKTK